jgi:hypothetical protein
VGAFLSTTCSFGGLGLSGLVTQIDNVCEDSGGNRQPAEKHSACGEAFSFPLTRSNDHDSEFSSKRLLRWGLIVVKNHGICRRTLDNFPIPKQGQTYRVEHATT